MPATIDWGTIGKLLWAAPLAGLAVAVTFSLVIHGVARADEARRDGDGTAAAIHSVVALVAGIAFVTVVVYGVTIIINK